MLTQASHRALEPVSDRSSGRGFPGCGGLPARLMRAAMDEGPICCPGGVGVDGAFLPHIMLARPITLQVSHMRECCDKLATVLDRAIDA